MPAEAKMQARAALAALVTLVSSLFPDLVGEVPPVEDLSEMATVARWDRLVRLFEVALPAGPRLALVHGAGPSLRRALGSSPLDRPEPEPGLGFARLVRSTIPDPGVPVDPPFPRRPFERVDDKTFAVEAQPIREAVEDAWRSYSDDDFPGGAA